MHRIILAVAIALPGCQAGYVLKQGARQVASSWNQVPLSSEELRQLLSEEESEKLLWIPRLLEFSRTDLGLTPGDSYQTFLDTGGKPVSHIVLASHPEAFVPYRWCFPFVGCVPYKGFFDKDDADEEAEELRQEGWDVAVLPVGAYSTLGWFRDPVLSTMLDKDLLDLLELLLHETVHRTLYVPDRTRFNESLATHVAREGLRLFLESYPQAAPARALENYMEKTLRRDQDQALIERLRWDLEALYRSALPSGAKMRRKQEIFETARAARALIHGYTAALPASNAYILASLRYHELLPAFTELQREHGGHPRDLMAYLKRTLEEHGSLPEVLR